MKILNLFLPCVLFQVYFSESAVAEESFEAKCPERFIEECGLWNPKYKFIVIINMIEQGQIKDETTLRSLATELDIELNCMKDHANRRIQQIKENIIRFKKEIDDSNNIDHIKSLLRMKEENENTIESYKEHLIFIDYLEKNTAELRICKQNSLYAKNEPAKRCKL